MPDQQHVTTASQHTKEAVATESGQPFDPVNCFKQMILARTINDILKMRKTQGKFHFYIGCAGHEAIAGVIAALRPDDWLTFYYRDLAGWLTRTRDPYAPIRGSYAREIDPMTGGRNLSEQFSSRRFRIMPYFSEIAALAPSALAWGSPSSESRQANSSRSTVAMAGWAWCSCIPSPSFSTSKRATSPSKLAQLVFFGCYLDKPPSLCARHC